jgi:O-antigen ligase
VGLQLNFDFLLVIAIILTISISSGIFAGMGSTIGVAIILFEVFLLLMWLIPLKRLWTYLLWIVIFGLTIWSYGFNNIPLVRPIPLVDAVIFLVVLLGFRHWWAFTGTAIGRKLLIPLLFLLIVIFGRLIVDVPKFGLLAGRDALFAFELWVIFPAIALGYMLGEHKLNQKLFLLFCVAMVWYLLFPWRELIESISPVVGIQRPVPLFAFTMAGFISVPMFFWFLYYPNRMVSIIGSSAALLILLMAQSRGGYLAILLGSLVIIFLRLANIKKFASILIPVAILVGIILAMFGNNIQGRVGQMGLTIVLEQLGTFGGKEGPGAGSFQHRLVAWPAVIEEVLSEPLGPLFGVGLGPDLFMEFALGPDILVRKPHNDFLEIWARLGVVGLIPWLCILVILGWEALKGTRRDPRQSWILALQITLWITSLSQPAMGFAYIVVPWAGLTGLWLGAQLRKKVARV